MTDKSLISEYNPIGSIVVLETELSNPTGLVVIVGPNSSGKTLFLQDIERRLLTGEQNFVVCKSISVKKPANFKTLISDMIEKNYVRSLSDSSGQYHTFIPHMGSILSQRHPNTRREAFQIDKLRLACDKMESEDKAAQTFFSAIGQALVSPLSLDDRRKVCNKASSFYHNRMSPDFPLQGLLVNSEAQKKITEETSRVFGNLAWLDLTEKDIIQLRVSGSADRPPIEETQNPFGAAKYRHIESEGDGYRSYVGICLSLLMGTRPVSLIDEPELCLHPPQAYRIGRFIGQHAKPTNQVTFVATHSSHVLRGILEASLDAKITIIRMTRRHDQFQATKIAENSLIDCIRNPRTRAEAVLDGLFARCVVLVESDGDREVYQAAFESIEDYASREIHFVPVGGTGGFADPCRFFHGLKIPVAIIADLDAICDTEKMISCVKSLIQRKEDTDEISDLLRNLTRNLKSMPPSITQDDVKAELKRLSDGRMDWDGGDDNTLRRGLSDLSERLRRLQRLKEGGLEAYNDFPELKLELETLLRKCNEIGLFFVPCGELEGWIPDLMRGHSKRSNKISRAAVAASKIREAEVKAGDIWAFCQSIFAFLKAQQDI